MKIIQPLLFLLIIMSYTKSTDFVYYNKEKCENFSSSCKTSWNPYFCNEVWVNQCRYAFKWFWSDFESQCQKWSIKCISDYNKKYQDICQDWERQCKNEWGFKQFIFRFKDENISKKCDGYRQTCNNNWSSECYGNFQECAEYGVILSFEKIAECIAIAQKCPLSENCQAQLIPCWADGIGKGLLNYESCVGTKDDCINNWTSVCDQNADICAQMGVVFRKRLEGVKIVIL